MELFRRRGQDAGGDRKQIEPGDHAHHDHIEKAPAAGLASQLGTFDQMNFAGDILDLRHEGAEIGIADTIEGDVGRNDRGPIHEHAGSARYLGKGPRRFERLERDDDFGLPGRDVGGVSGPEHYRRLDAAAPLRQAVDLADPGFEAGLHGGPSQKASQTDYALAADADNGNLQSSAQSDPTSGDRATG